MKVFYLFLITFFLISPINATLSPKVVLGLSKIYKTAILYKEKTLQLDEEKQNFIEKELSENNSISDVETSAIKSEYTYYTIFDGGYKNELGYVFFITENGKWGKIKFIVILDNNKVIKRVEITKTQEKLGKYITRQSFLRQYRNKTVNSSLKLKKDIKYQAGATISCRASIYAIKKSLLISAYFS